jgi:hypothetical protein
MHTFAVVENHFKGMNLKYGWCYVASSIYDIIAYNESIMTPKVEKAFKDSAEQLRTMNHPRDFLGGAIVQMGKLTGESLVTSYLRFGDQFTRGQLSLLAKYKTLYFQKAGGYFPHTSDLHIVKQITKDSPEYPNSLFQESEIKITKWPEGRHYYVVCPDKTIVKDHSGNTRFNTYEYACEVRKWFVEKSLIEISSRKISSKTIQKEIEA